METREILSHVDHTLLKAFATWEDIQKICEEAMEYGTASVCIPASYIKRVIDDKCIILFLRLRKEMEKSLVTVEIEGNRVIQARGMSNRNITNDERKALIEYCKKVGYDMKTN